MPRMPRPVVQMVFRAATGAAREFFRKDLNKGDNPLSAPGKADGRAVLDDVGFCVVVIGTADGSAKRVRLWGFEGKEEDAVKEAVQLARTAWAAYVAAPQNPQYPAGGQALAWKGSGGYASRRPRVAVGVVFEDPARGPVPLDKAAKAAQARWGTFHETTSGGFGVLKVGGGGAEGALKLLMDVAQAMASSEDVEPIFQQHRGAIVWIDEEEVEQVVADFNGVRTWEIAIARDRAAAAIEALSDQEPYGSKKLFGGDHGAVGVYSQASSGPSSAGDIVVTVRNDYEANA